jgi:hypothetical protein
VRPCFSLFHPIPRLHLPRGRGRHPYADGVARDEGRRITLWHWRGVPEDTGGPGPRRDSCLSRLTPWTRDPCDKVQVWCDRRELQSERVRRCVRRRQYFVDAVAEVTQRYVKNLGHSSVRLRDMRDRVGDAGAQKEGSGREELPRNYRAVQDAGPAGRAPTADDEHVDENARFSILQTDDHETGGHETAQRETSYRAVVETRQETSRAAMIARHVNVRHLEATETLRTTTTATTATIVRLDAALRMALLPNVRTLPMSMHTSGPSLFLLSILTRNYDSSSVKCRFTGDVDDGVSFDGWRSRFYRLIGPSGFGVDDERLKIALIIAAVGGKAETFLLSDVNPDRSDPDPPSPCVAANSSLARTLWESFLRFEMYFLNSSARAGLRTKAMSLSVRRHLQRTHGLLLDQALRDFAEQIRKLAANGPSIYNNEAGMMDVMDYAVVDMPWTVPLRPA